MFFRHYQEEDEATERLELVEQQLCSSAPPSCSQGHRSSLIVQTLEGGAICLLCFTNLVSSPTSPTVHVSYALSQLSRAISHPPFLHSLLSFHTHLLASPLVQALSAFDDDPIASQTTDLISDLCDSGDSAVFGEFMHRISERLSSGTLAWSRRQVYTLHCLGVLLNCQLKNPYAYIRDKNALVASLVAGLQLPSEDIRGEILFVLYKLSILQSSSMDDDGDFDIFSASCPKILRLSLEALLKTQSDDVRLNCVALLSVMAQRGYFLSATANGESGLDSDEADNFMQETDDSINQPAISILFAEALKGPLLSSDSKVQIGTLELVFHYLSQDVLGEQTQILVQENIADYVFEILRLSESKDPTVNSCIQVLALLSTAEQAFTERLPMGFSCLLAALHYISEIPFHPVQHQILKLILNCVTNCPGVISTSYLEELGMVLKKILRHHSDGELGMQPETFNLACSILVALTKLPSYGNSNFAIALQDASKDAVLACIGSFNRFPSQLLHSLYLLKEAYAYSCASTSNNLSTTDLGNSVLSVCKMHLLPSLVMAINEMEEDLVLGVLETFHSILLQESNVKSKEFAGILVSSSWFSLAFGFLGLFPTDKMKWRVYLMFSSIIDILLQNDSGQIIRDAALYLPCDPIDLLFLLGQSSLHNQELLNCQTSALLIIEISSFHDVRLAEDKVILASLEQYILVNNDLLRGTANGAFTQLVNLYSLYRGIASSRHHVSYSAEAEGILLYLMAEKDWNFINTGFHVKALKWLFQQEMIIKQLSGQILQFCKSNASCSHIIVHGKSCQGIDTRAIAELIAAGDNFGSTVFICLIEGLLKEDGKEQDLISVLDLMGVIISIIPEASDQFCLHGMNNTVLNLIYHLNQFSSQKFCTAILLLIFNILRSVHPEMLHDEAWTMVAMKLIDYMIHIVATDSWSPEALLGTGILCLILHHATKKALVESAKVILLNRSLGSVVRSAIKAGCARGPALADHDEGTGSGETLIFILLLQYFALRSRHGVLPGIMDTQYFFSALDENQVSLITIPCHDLCRLMHFGTPRVKLVSSFCLLELFTKALYQENKRYDKLSCSTGYISSVMGIFEGLMFYSDNRVALNCGMCLAVILSREEFGMKNARVAAKINWCRLIVEELAMSLAVPCLASNTFANYHKPAVHVAVALLGLQTVPEWMRSVFDSPCISGILDNVSASNMSRELVLLFRELTKSQYLNDKQISNLNQLLQACRKHIYLDNKTRSDKTRSGKAKECMEKVVSGPAGSTEAREVLIEVMSSEPHKSNRNKGLLKEIDTFFQSLAKGDGGGQ